MTDPILSQGQREALLNSANYFYGRATERLEMLVEAAHWLAKGDDDQRKAFAAKVDAYRASLPSEPLPALSTTPTDGRPVLADDCEGDLSTVPISLLTTPTPTPLSPNEEIEALNARDLKEIDDALANERVEVVARRIAADEGGDPDEEIAFMVPNGDDFPSLQRGPRWHNYRRAAQVAIETLAAFAAVEKAAISALPGEGLRTAWLLEMEGNNPPVWLRLQEPNYGEAGVKPADKFNARMWQQSTSDANQALAFSRKDDAEQFLLLLRPRGQFLKATEHKFIAALREPTT